MLSMEGDKEEVQMQHQEEDAPQRSIEEDPKRSRSKSPVKRSASPSKPSDDVQMKDEGSSNGQNPSSANGSSSGQGNTLFVTGLDQATREPELKEIFGSFGSIEHVKVVCDPNDNVSRGFGFVTFATAEEAEAALIKLDQSEVNGKMITVQKAKRTRPRSPTPGRYFGRSTRHDPYYRGGPPSRHDSRYGRGYDRYEREYYPPRRGDDRPRYDDYHRGERRYDDRRGGGPPHIDRYAPADRGYGAPPPRRY